MALDALDGRGEIQMVDRAREVVPGDKPERVFGNEEGVGVVISVLKLLRGEFSEGAAPAICTTLWSTVPSTRRMASTAACLTAARLPRPIQRAAASAAASVTRHSSMAMLRSSPPREGKLDVARPSGVGGMAMEPSSTLR